MRYEDEHDYDCQSSPRFWVLRDYRIVPANEEYDDGFTQYFYNDGDFVEFDDVDDLREFIEDYFEDWLSDKIFMMYTFEKSNTTLKDIWQMIEMYDVNGFFGSCYVKEEVFIVPDTMFLTKEEAKKHIERNRHHYTSKVHTYAMTAWRSPKVERLLDVLMNMDWDKVKVD